MTKIWRADIIFLINFQDIGWTFGQPQTPDLRLIKSVAGDPDPAPGEPVAFVLSVENIGGASATGIVLTDVLPDEIVPVSWNASGALAGATLRAGTTYVWDLPDLAAGASGEIDVSGTITPGLSAHMAIVTQAVVSSDEDSDGDNNSSLAIVGGHRNYLPLIIRPERNKTNWTDLVCCGILALNFKEVV